MLLLTKLANEVQPDPQGHAQKSVILVGKTVIGIKLNLGSYLKFALANK